MQAPHVPERTGNPAVRIGLIFGGILAALSLAHALFLWATGGYDARVITANGSTTVVTDQVGASILLGCVLFLVLLGITFIAGIRAAQQNGKVGSGALAGLIAGGLNALLGSIIGIIVTVTTVAPNLQAPADSALTQGELQAILIGTVIVAALIGLLFDIG